MRDYKYLMFKIIIMSFILASIVITSSEDNIIKVILYYIIAIVVECILVVFASFKLELEDKFTDRLLNILGTNALFIFTSTLVIYIIAYLLKYTILKTIINKSVFSYITTLGILLSTAYPNKKFIEFLHYGDYKDKSNKEDIEFDFIEYEKILAKVNLRKLTYLVSIIIAVSTEILELNKNVSINIPILSSISPIIMSKAVITFIVIDSAIQVFKEDKSKTLESENSIITNQVSAS